jgi:formamidopyrimidine-DNA glycosylase
LERHLVGRTIVGGRVPNPKILAGSFDSSSKFLEMVCGRRLTAVSRRGKHLILDLDSGYHLLIHLKMRGQLLVVPREAADQKYLTLSLEFDDGRELRFHDMWTWGEARLTSASELRSHEAIGKLGAEPLSEAFSSAVLKESLGRHPHSRVKAALLDQSVVAGIGNIYADEALFSSRIRPERSVDSLSIGDIEHLTLAIRDVLGRATESGGTQSDNYVNADGIAGLFVPLVYGRGGKPCPRCGNLLKRTKVGGRGTVYCPDCQS